VPARKMSKLGAPTTKELSGIAPLESELRAIKGHESGAEERDDELDFNGEAQR